MVRLLILSNVMPYPAHGGVHQRIFNILKRVAEHHEVTLGCHVWGDEDEEGATWLTRNGIPTVTGRLRPANWRHVLPAIGAVLAGRPPELVQFSAPELRALVAGKPFDVIQVEETLLAPYLNNLPPGADTKSVLVFHNVHFVQEQRLAALEKRRRDRLWRAGNAVMMRRYEPMVARRFNRSIAVSEGDRALLRAAAPDLQIDVLPNGVDTAALHPLPVQNVRPTLIFVGSLNYRPCADAVIWLVAAILPGLQRRFPDLEFWIVGKSPPPEVQGLAAPNVFVTGEVADVTPYYLRSSVAVVPLRAGGGSRLKILEAMALGRPVVSTTIGAEGLEVTHGQDILLADNAAAFTQAIVDLLTGEALCRSLTDKARRLVVDRHDWDQIARQQLTVYDEILERS
jgi:glycosyltransferase involved in cell wall biosynthesis